jgi:hypothetical protein
MGVNAFAKVRRHCHNSLVFSKRNLKCVDLTEQKREDENYIFNKHIGVSK